VRIAKTDGCFLLHEQLRAVDPALMIGVSLPINGEVLEFRVDLGVPA